MSRRTMSQIARLALTVGRSQFDTDTLQYNFPILSQSPLDYPGEDAMHALHRARLAPTACRTVGKGLGDLPNWHSGSSEWSASIVASGKL